MGLSAFKRRTEPNKYASQFPLQSLYEVPFLPSFTPPVAESPAPRFFPELQPQAIGRYIWTLGLKSDHSLSWECRPGYKDQFSKIRGVGVGEVAQGSVPSMHMALTIVCDFSSKSVPSLTASDAQT